MSARRLNVQMGGSWSTAQRKRGSARTVQRAPHARYAPLPGIAWLELEHLDARMRAALLSVHRAVRSATYTEKRRVVSVRSVAMVMAVQPQQYLCHSAFQVIQQVEQAVHRISTYAVWRL